MARGSIDVPPICLTLIGTIQPDVLSKLLLGGSNSISPNLEARVQFDNKEECQSLN